MAAVAALAEALDFSDVIAEIGEANWSELLQGMRIQRLPTRTEFAKGAAIVLGPVVGEALPIVIERIRNNRRRAHFTRNINHTHVEARMPADVRLPRGSR